MSDQQQNRLSSHANILITVKSTSRLLSVVYHNPILMLTRVCNETCKSVAIFYVTPHTL